MVRRALARRRLAQRLRITWDWYRPLPSPQYIAGTPRVGGNHPLDPYLPPNVPTLAEAALSVEAANFVAEVVQKLTPTDETREQPMFYQWSQAKFGRYRRNADITTLLRAAALLIRPQTYLEIGVRRGRSSAVVGATCPDCAIYGFDLWLPGYAGDSNPGPEFVRNELRSVGHSGPVEFISGDSASTVPAFLRAHPDLYFDLITVDGDHSVMGAARDLANTLPRLKLGGILVFDDICSAPLLQRVWQRLVMRDGRHATWEFTDNRYGVAAAIRLSDEATLRPFYGRGPSAR